MNSVADTVVTTVNAVITFGITKISAAPDKRQIPENVSPAAGTACFDRRENSFGATPHVERLYSIRDVDYTPPLADEAADVSTTKFTIPAAAGSPIIENIPTNGLLSGDTVLHGVTAIIAIRANT